MQILEAPTDHIQQATGYYCGAACSQMLLNRVKISKTQDVIYEAIQEHNAESDAFYSDPQGISKVLNSKGFDAFDDGEFIIVEEDDQTAIADKIFDNIFDNKTPLVCLVNGGNHWVICHKVVYDLTEARSVKLLGVFLLDPAPSSPPEIYVPIEQFIASVLNPNKFGAIWRDKRVFLAVAKTVARSSSVALAIQKSPKGGGAGELEVPDADIVMSNLRNVGVADAKRPLGGGAAPLRVRDLFDGSYYFVIPLDALSDKIFHSMIHAAVKADGTVLEVTRELNRPFFATDTLARESLRSEFGGNDFAIDPELFWKSGGILRNRFTIARRAVKGEREVWVLPTGEILANLDSATRGGR